MIEYFPILLFIIFKLSSFWKTTCTDSQVRAETWAHLLMREHAPIFIVASGLIVASVSEAVPPFPGTYLHHSLQENESEQMQQIHL